MAQSHLTTVPLTDFSDQVYIRYLCFGFLKAVHNHFLCESDLRIPCLTKEEMEKLAEINTFRELSFVLTNVHLN